MYYFCKRQGLSEVWAYMWASWYSPQMWKLWACSTNDQILSWLQTTMMTENHWKQLKHHHLRFMHHPWLDQTIYIMIQDVIPAAIITSKSLEGTRHIGAAVELMTFQQELKQLWKTLSQQPLLGKDYGTNVQNSTCQCAAQQFQPQH